MAGEQTAMPLFGIEQEPLPGTEEIVSRKQSARSRSDARGPSQIPLMVPVGESEPEWPLRPEVPAGQLSFGPHQLSLDDAEAEPEQLQLLPSPAFWEGAEKPEAPTPSKGRLSRQRSRRGITPGQRSLF